MKEAFVSIIADYDKLRKKGIDEESSGILIAEIVRKSILLLSSVEEIALNSKVPNKTYFAYKLPGNNKISRAINRDLYKIDFTSWDLVIKSIKEGNLEEYQKEELSKLLYTAAISFCAVNDLFKVGDQKTPGTFFEYFVAYLFKICLKVIPVTSIKVLDYDDLNISLQTDNIYNLGTNLPKFHVPIKTSTRERAIMLWAHQKLLDGGKHSAIPIAGYIFSHR